jgi:hypothetical protein
MCQDLERKKKKSNLPVRPFREAERMSFAWSHSHTHVYTKRIGPADRKKKDRSGPTFFVTQCVWTLPSLYFSILFIWGRDWCGIHAVVPNKKIRKERMEVCACGLLFS